MQKLKDQRGRGRGLALLAAGVAAFVFSVVPDLMPAASSAAVILRAWPGCTGHHASRR